MKFRVLEKSFINNVLVEPGAVVDVDLGLDADRKPVKWSADTHANLKPYKKGEVVLPDPEGDDDADDADADPDGDSGGQGDQS